MTFLRTITAFALSGAIIQSASAQRLEPGQVAPEIKLEETVRGPEPTELTLEKLKGDVVYLEFWATWCGPCIASMPHLTELAKDFEGKDIHFLLITDEKRDRIEKFLKRRDLPGYVVLDTDKSIFKAYGVGGIPDSIIIGRDGKIVVRDHPTKVNSELLKGILDGTVSAPAASTTAATMTAMPIAATKGADAPAAEESSEKADSAGPKLSRVAPGIDPLLMDYLDAGVLKFDSAKPQYTTVIRPTVYPDANGYGATLGYAVGRKTGWAMTKLGVDLVGLVKACKVEIRSDQRLIIEDGLDTESLWDIVLSRPEGWDYIDALDDLLAASERVLGFEITERVENRACLVPDLSSVVATDKIIRMSSLDRDDPTAMSFQSLAGCVRSIERNGGDFVADTERDEDPWLVDMYGVELWKMDPADVRKWLEDAGVRFTVEERPVTFTVVSPRD